MIPSQQISPSDAIEATACRCCELAPGAERSTAATELGELARELARGFGERVESYRKYCNLSPQEARQRAAENSPECIERILHSPPDEVNWCDLDALARKDEGLALER